MNKEEAFIPIQLADNPSEIVMVGNWDFKIAYESKGLGSYPLQMRSKTKKKYMQ